VFAARDAGREEAWSTNLDLFAVPSDGTARPRSLTRDNPATDTPPSARAGCPRSRADHPPVAHPAAHTADAARSPPKPRRLTNTSRSSGRLHRKERDRIRKQHYTQDVDRVLTLGPSGRLPASCVMLLLNHSASIWLTRSIFKRSNLSASGTYAYMLPSLKSNRHP